MDEPTLEEKRCTELLDEALQSFGGHCFLKCAAKLFREIHDSTTPQQIADILTSAAEWEW